MQPIMFTGSPLIRVIRGKLSSEVHVMFPMVQHVLRISNSTGNCLCVREVCVVLPTTRDNGLYLHFDYFTAKF